MYMCRRRGREERERRRKSGKSGGGGLGGLDEEEKCGVREGERAREMPRSHAQECTYAVECREGVAPPHAATLRLSSRAPIYLYRNILARTPWNLASLSTARRFISSLC
jgi:hypothetical protein